ncbi:DNA-binding domain-containing protein [Artemisia annua]|uniref:DNA-binding domain-containing protein n=1 Tax=Artemisia annua TaxID=35608 RepID=A0A2U1LWI7_ARTAN|nr:DNA-binding domain-containing protein [Artemisia annua]
MSSDDWPEWLPGDWTVQIRKIDQKKVKCYVDPQGHKCYSKPQVLDHLSKTNKSTANESAHTNDGPESTPRSRSARRATGSGNNTPNGTDGTLVEAGDRSSSEPHTSPNEVGMSNWLPDGWTEEVKIRKGGRSAGTKYRIYTDPITGQKFFSRPQVQKYLGTLNDSPAVVKTPTDNAEKRQSATEISQSGSVKKESASARFSSEYLVVSRTTTVEGLPEGWIKEVRTRKRGGANRKDPFYLDPSSDYAFFSKKDALRYLETGDVTKCVIKPVRRNADDSPDVTLTLTEGLASPTIPLKGTETSEAVPNGDENGSQNKTPARSISGGTFPTPDTKEIRSISGGTVTSDWLPEGWTVEVLAKATGQKYKVFKETATGKKFYSKPQVLKYLGIADDSSISNKRKETALSVTPVSSVAPTSAEGSQGKRPKRSKTKKDDTQNLDFTEEITTTAADGLPAGWIKETRTKIFATHKRTDPFYTDPATGYIFRSKLDALRFLETGDVNICAIRPKVKDKDGNEVFVYTHDVQKPGQATTGEQLLEGKEDVPTDGAVPMTQVPARGRGRPPKLNSRSSKRQKGINLETEPSLNPAEDNETETGLNLEKQADDERLSFQIEEAENWTDQCLDFAVKTLTDEILFNGQPASSSLQDGNGEVDNGVKETPTQANQ